MPGPAIRETIAAALADHRRGREVTEDVFTRAKLAAQVADHARSNPAVLRASGMRLVNMSAQRMQAVAGNKQPWQGQAWGYRDMIGELRFALTFRAYALAKAVFFIAEVPEDDEDDLIPVSLRNDVDDDGKPTEKAAQVTLDPRLCADAEEELRRLPLRSGYGFTGVFSENLDVAGECFLHGHRDPDTGEEKWQIRSVLDVNVQGSRITVKDELGQDRPLRLGDGEEEAEDEIYRLWIPHPAHPNLADSALRALADTLEDIALIGRELRAAARSRIAANGIWLIPDTMMQQRNVQADSEEPIDHRAKFMADLIAMMLAPITNEGDPGGVVPGIIGGTREDIEIALKSHIRFEREDSPTLLEKLSKALARMANSLDIAPEIITGMADVNHWTAWQIDQTTFRHFLEPSLRNMVDALTEAFLRQALLARGWAAEQVNRIRIWYSGGKITENPNRRQDALDAYDRAAISGEAFREALGFSDSDAPTAEEQLIQIAARQGFDQGAAAALLASWARENGASVPELAGAENGAQGPNAPQQRALPPARPDPTGVGGTGAPSTAPAGIAASADPTTDHRPVIATFRDGRWWAPLGDMLPPSGLTPREQAQELDITALVAGHRGMTAAGPPRANGYRLDTDTPAALVEIERALRVELLAAADAATDRALERAGSRLRSKATRDPALTASLRALPVAEWPAAAGRAATFALGADTRFLLAEAWDKLRAIFQRKVSAAIGEITERVVTRLLGLEPHAATAARGRMRAEMESRIDDAWAALVVELETNADKLMFDDELFGEGEGEQTDLSVPPGLIRGALAHIGGLPESSGGTDRDRTVTGEARNGLATGSTVARELEHAGTIAVGYLWVYGVTPRESRFEPHWELEGERFAGWDDPKLLTNPKTAWLGPFMHPGDHRGCACDYVPAYAVPEYSTQVRDRLGTPAPPTQWLLNLATADDDAGRTGTSAQAARDQWQAIQELQARFLNGER